MDKLVRIGMSQRALSYGKNLLWNRLNVSKVPTIARVAVMSRPIHSSSAVRTTYYTTQHEWVSVNEGKGTVGITTHAKNLLGDIVFCELPELNKEYEKGEPMAVIESVKAASDMYAPVSGEVIKVNEILVEQASLITNSPTEEGWIVEIRLLNENELEELMNEEEYDEFIKEEH